MVQGPPPTAWEPDIIQQQPGVSNWIAAAADFDIPWSYDSDVFIRHAGIRTDKPLTRALKRLLEKMGWYLGVNTDDEPRMSPEEWVRHGMRTSRVVVLLFSWEYFQLASAKEEMRDLLDQYALQRVRLLPVFLRIPVEDCKRQMTRLLGRGMCTYQGVHVCILFPACCRYAPHHLPCLQTLRPCCPRVSAIAGRPALSSPACPKRLARRCGTLCTRSQSSSQRTLRLALPATEPHYTISLHLILTLNRMVATISLRYHLG